TGQSPLTPLKRPHSQSPPQVPASVLERLKPQDCQPLPPALDICTTPLKKPKVAESSFESLALHGLKKYYLIPYPHKAKIEASAERKVHRLNHGAVHASFAA